MLWLYERGVETLSIETRFNNTSSAFELIWHRADGTDTIESFGTEGEFRVRLSEVKEALSSQRWAASGSPTILTDGWRIE